MQRIENMRKINLRAGVKVPEYVIPYRPMVIREAGRDPVKGPSRMTPTQNAILAFLGDLVWCDRLGCLRQRTDAERKADAEAERRTREMLRAGRGAGLRLVR